MMSLVPWGIAFLSLLVALMGLLSRFWGKP